MPSEKTKETERAVDCEKTVPLMLIFNWRWGRRRDGVVCCAQAIPSNGRGFRIEERCGQEHKDIAEARAHCAEMNKPTVGEMGVDKGSSLTVAVLAPAPGLNDHRAVLSLRCYNFYSYVLVQVYADGQERNVIGAVSSDSIIATLCETPYFHLWEFIPQLHALAVAEMARRVLVGAAHE